MAKNLIPEIARMLGVELGEAFKIKGDDELTYRFTNAGLKLTHDSGIEISVISADVAFAALVKGTDEIIKLPWKPKFGDRYFGVFEFNGKLMVCRYDIWRETIAEKAQYRCGWVYRTKEEAEAALPKVAKEMGVDYEL
jgi:hypothetical protein